MRADSVWRLAIVVALGVPGCTGSNPDDGASPAADRPSVAADLVGTAPADLASPSTDLASPSTDLASPSTDLASPHADLTVQPGGRDFALHPAVFRATGSTDIYAVGDAHGDPAAFVKTLTGAGLVKGNGPYTWAGGNAILVVTGDTIDKGTSALAVIDILIALEADAAKKGGQVVVTLGNHEAEFLADPTSVKTDNFQAELKGAGLDPVKVAAGASVYGEWLRTRPVAALVDEWFFAHAGNAGGMSATAMAQKFEALFAQGAFGDAFLVGADSVLEAKKNWWGSGTKQLDAVLGALPAKHIVYGHQPNLVPCPGAPEGDRAAEALATCYGGRLFMEDVGMSAAVDPKSKGGLLHIHRGSPSTVTAVYPGGTTKAVWKG